MTTENFGATQLPDGRWVFDTSITSQDPAAEGRHVLEAQTSDMVIIQSGDNAGKPMLKIRFRVVGGPSDGKAVFAQFLPWGGGRFRFEQLIQAAGLANVPNASPDMLTGKTVEAELKHREWNGEKRAEINKVFVDTGSSPMVGSSVGGGRARDDDDEDVPF
jgi:hypothetical protein